MNSVITAVHAHVEFTLYITPPSTLPAAIPAEAMPVVKPSQVARYFSSTASIFAARMAGDDILPAIELNASRP